MPSKTQTLYQTAKKVIPGGTQLLTKRPEFTLPNLWPAYYEKAKGCKVWDLDNKVYYDTGYMGVGTCLLGFADPDVDKAVNRAIRRGSMATLNCPEEVALAKLLCKLHPWADMARFARTGGEALAMSVRIARAKTSKELILFCGYHGWHDWYLSSNLGNQKSLDGHLLPGLEPKGVPRNLKGTAIPFGFNDIESFLKLIQKYKGKIAAVVMEPVRFSFPKKDFLETIRKVTQKNKILLIFDETSSGFRLKTGGAHLKFKIEPDAAVFGKAMSNGYPMACVLGKKDVMQAAQDTFMSSTYWTERVGPTAALATIEKIKAKKVSQLINRLGAKVQKSWKQLAKKHNLSIRVSEMKAISHFSFEADDSLEFKTLFSQAMLEEGFLASNLFYLSYVHRKGVLDKYSKALENAFRFVGRAQSSRKPKNFLKTDVCQKGFKRIT